MESASVAHAYYINNIPFIVIRSALDNVDEYSSKNFENNIEKAALNSISLVERVIGKLGLTKK